MASHRASQLTLARRTRCQACPSWRVIGRSRTPRDSRTAGHPAVSGRSRRSVDGVAEQRYDDRQPVLHPAPRARQVHDERVTDRAGDPARQRCRRDPLAHAVGPDRLRDARHLAVEQAAGDLGRQVGRRQSGASGRQHGPGAVCHRRADGVRHRLSVRYDDRRVDLPALGPERLDDDGAGVVVVHASSRAVRRDHHHGPEPGLRPLAHLR